MDIPKYIGLFLLKNSYCYLHGLGNLELKKRPARYEGDALHAPEYDVALTPGGSIDDTFANYIATHEQTSISKAANELREWSTATRAELAAGKDVEIPGVGKFVDASGLVKFVANPHFQHTPPPVPVLRMSKRLDEQPDFRRESNEPSDNSGSRSMAWGRIGVLVLLLVALLAGGYFVYQFFSTRSDTAPVKTKDTATIAQPLPPVAVPPTDTVPHTDTVVRPAPAAASADGAYTVVLNTYPSRAAADRRANQLSKLGNAVEVRPRDSAVFLVVMHLTVSPADTAKQLDSLRRMFNPKGVYILR